MAPNRFPMLEYGLGHGRDSWRDCLGNREALRICSLLDRIGSDRIGWHSGALLGGCYRQCLRHAWSIAWSIPAGICCNARFLGSADLNLGAPHADFLKALVHERPVDDSELRRDCRPQPLKLRMWVMQREGEAFAIGRQRARGPLSHQQLQVEAAFRPGPRCGRCQKIADEQRQIMFFGLQLIPFFRSPVGGCAGRETLVAGDQAGQGAPKDYAYVGYRTNFGWAIARTIIR